jgi:TatA/E family protein of Tat protein translocase
MRVLENPFILLGLLVLALIIFGPRRLPELGSSLGRAIREFRKATSEMGETLKAEATKPAEDAPSATGTTYPPVTPAEPHPQSPPAQTAPPPEAPKA